MSGHPFYFSSARSSVHGVVVIYYGIVHHSSPIDDFNLGAVMRIRRIEAPNIVMVDSGSWNKYPVTGWNIDSNVDRYPWAKRSPAVVSAP